MSRTSPPLRVAVCDYGAGNLHSLGKALAAPDVEVRVESDARLAADRARTDLMVLPGVGGFEAAAERLAPARDEIRAAAGAGLPVLGICLGMQLFFEESEEGVGQGLGLLSGRVRRLRARRVPQIGWNQLEPEGQRETALAEGTLRVAYYANSYVCEPEDVRWVTAWSEHEGDRFPASVRGGVGGSVVGVQFHPEKSSTAGVDFLRRLLARVRAELSR
jgi:glutamine amidotransferase